MTGKSPYSLRGYPAVLAFVQDLIERGRVVVSLGAEPTTSSPGGLESLLFQLDQQAKLEFAFTPPTLSPVAAMWALEFIENTCRFLVYRELEEEMMAELLNRDCPVPPSAERIYSADLFLRYLPELFRMASAAGEKDPLVKHLELAAERWPLSSVGIPKVICEPGEVDRIISDPSLCQLYVDRIIERGDISRLKSAAVRTAVGTVLGAHASLSPQMSKAIANYSE